MSLLTTLSGVLDPDRAALLAMDGLIEAAGVKYALDVEQERWTPGKPLKILLAGYQGSRNTGSDIRPEEMIRQFRTIWGDDNLEISIFTIEPKLTAGYFRTAKQITLPLIYPLFLASEVPKHHAVIGVEGSMFKSNFANAVTTVIAGSMGLANAQGKVSVGYGAEAGKMDPHLARFVERHCKQSLVICRNEPSKRILADLGMRTLSGTDTAWTFRADPRSKGAEILRSKGWDGRKKIIAAGPVNPFWWPVKPDLFKAMAWRFEGQYREEHYRSVYFHQWDDTGKQKYERYVCGFAECMDRFAKRSDMFPLLFGMEQLDRRSCEDVAARMSCDVPVIVSDEHNMYEMISILHCCSLLVSSRFHALVTSMLGSVPSAGVSFDERVTNLLNDRGHQDYLLLVEADNLGDRLYEVMCRLEKNSAQVVEDIERFVPAQLKKLGQMGIDLQDEVARVYPEFPRRSVPRSWENFVPQPSPDVQSMLEKYG